MRAADSHFAIEGMHCNSCGLLVDETVEGLAGVIRCATSVRRGNALVEFDPAVVTVGEITAAIVELGYACVPAGREGG